MIKVLGFALEAAVILTLVICVYSQLVKPLISRTPVFPVFRKRPKTERDIEAANEALGDKALQRDLTRKQRKLGGGHHGQQQGSTTGSKS